MPPIIDCDTEAQLQAVIQETIACLIRGGFRVAYWALYGDIDWSSVTHTNGSITAWAMVTDKLFYKVEFNKKDATHFAEYTEDTQVYTEQIQMIFDSLVNKDAIQSALNTGCIVFHLFDNNCKEYVYGVQYNPNTDAFERTEKTLRVGRHRIDGGQLGSSIARNELDLVGESSFGPIEAAVGEENVPITAP